MLEPKHFRLSGHLTSQLAPWRWKMSFPPGEGGVCHPFNVANFALEAQCLPLYDRATGVSVQEWGPRAAWTLTPTVQLSKILKWYQIIITVIFLVLSCVTPKVQSYLETTPCMVFGPSPWDLITPSLCGSSAELFQCPAVQTLGFFGVKMWPFFWSQNKQLHIHISRWILDDDFERCLLSIVLSPVVSM